MALQDWIDESNNATFQGKVDFYVVSAAVAVMGEDLTGRTAIQHQKRVALARLIMGGNIPAGFYDSVVLNGTIQGHIDAATSYDGDLAFTVNSVYDKVAGYDALVDEPPA